MTAALDVVGGNTPANSVNTSITSGSASIAAGATISAVVIDVALSQDGGNVASAIASMTCTWGGQACTVVSTPTPPTVSSTSTRIRRFVRLASDSGGLLGGTRTVAIAWTGALNHCTAIIHAKTYTGTGLGYHNTAVRADESANNSTAFNVSSATGEIVDGFFAHGASITNNGLINSGTQRRLNNVDTASAGNNAVSGTWSGATTVSVGATSSGNDSWLSHAGAVYEASGGTTTTTPAVVTMTASVPSPTIQLSRTATPAVVTMAATVPSPTVLTNTSATGTPAVVTLTASVPAPSLAVGRTATPTVVTLTASVLAPQSAGPPGARYPAAVGTDNRLIDQYNEPYMMKAISSWGFAMRATHTEITDKLEELQALGFNAVNFAFCGGVDSQSDWDAVQYENAVGDPFFTGTPFQSSLGDGFDTTVHIVSECERLGMTAMCALFISYGNTGVRAEIDAASNAQMRSFGAAVGALLDDYPNVVWEIEADDGWQPDNTTARRIDYLARGIDEGRTSYPNMWFAETYSNAPDSMGMFLEEEGTDPTGYQWLHLDANGLYWYGSDHVPAIESAYSAAVGFTTRDIALWDSEPGYAQAGQYADPQVGGTAQSQMQGVRQRTLSVFIEGGSGINWGHERWWPFDLTGLFPSAQPPDWHDVPASDEAVQAGYAWTIVDTYITEAGWAPTSAFVTTGQGTGTAKAAQGASSIAALAFFQHSRTIVVDTTIIAGSGNVRLRWYDPTAGTYTSIAGSEAQNASRSITHPGNTSNSDGAGDWLLIVDQAPAASATATPTVVTLTATVPAPVPSATVTVSATVVTMAATVPSPTLTRSATATPTVVTAIASVPAPTVTGSAVATPAVVTMPATVPAPTLTAAATVGPSVVTMAATVPAPTVTGGATPEPAVITLIASVPAPAVAVGRTVTPTVITLIAEVPAPSLSTGAGAVATPLVVTMLAEVLTPAVAVGGTVSAAVVTLTATVPSPAVTAGGSATAAPSVVTMIAEVAAPAVTGSAVATAAVVTMLAEVAAPTVAISVVAVPAVITLIASVPSPAVTTGGAALPAVVTLIATVPAPVVTLTGDATAGPAVVTVIAAPVAPTIAAAVAVIATVITLIATVPSPTVTGQTSTSTAASVVTMIASVLTPTVMAAQVFDPLLPVPAARTMIVEAETRVDRGRGDDRLWRIPKENRG